MNHLPYAQRTKLEKDYVKYTYEAIAEDFSLTRSKKWPRVENFLAKLSPKSIILDVGCGNGKYLNNTNTYNIGCDFSGNLLRICKKRNFEVVQCDMTKLPFREGSFDALICIAALHHIVNEDRRQDCLYSMSNLLIQGGQFLVQVWAFEQEVEKNNPYLKNKPTQSSGTETRVDIGNSTQIAIHRNRTPFEQQDLLVPFQTRGSTSISDPESRSRQLRYYHLFKEKELDDIVDKIHSVRKLDSYYDCGNWCVVAERVKTAAKDENSKSNF